MIETLIGLAAIIVMFVLPVVAIILIYNMYCRVKTLQRKIDAVMQKLIDMQ